MFLDVRARESSVNALIAFSTKCSSRRILFSRAFTNMSAILLSFSDDLATASTRIFSSILRPGATLCGISV
jgi:hypothetical protein